MGQKIWEIPGEEWRKRSIEASERMQEVINYSRSSRNADNRGSSFEPRMAVQPRECLGMKDEVVFYKPDLIRDLGKGDDEAGAREYTRLGLEIRSSHGMVNVDLTELRTKLATPAIQSYQAPSLKILSSSGLTLY